MAKIVSIVNMKGGVGKTTLTLHLGYDLARRLNKKVLLVDFDPQANASEGLLTPDRYKDHLKRKKTVSNLFSRSHELISPIKSQTPPKPLHLDELVIRARSFEQGYLDLVPSDMHLSNVLERTQGGNLDFKLQELLRGTSERYDYVLIDCCPTYSVLTNNALIASDRVLLPVKPDAHAARGIPKLLAKIDDFNRDAIEQNKVLNLGIVFTVVDEGVPAVTGIMAEILRQNRNVFQSFVKFSRSYSRAMVTSETVFEITRVLPATKNNLYDVTNEFLRRVEANQ